MDAGSEKGGGKGGGKGKGRSRTPPPARDESRPRYSASNPSPAAIEAKICTRWLHATCNKTGNHDGLRHEDRKLCNYFKSDPKTCLYGDGCAYAHRQHISDVQFVARPRTNSGLHIVPKDKAKVPADMKCWTCNVPWKDHNKKGWCVPEVEKRKVAQKASGGMP